jgi:hypothetical protein
MLITLIALALASADQTASPGSTATSSQAQEQTPQDQAPAPTSPGTGFMTGYDPHPRLRPPLNAPAGYSPDASTYSVHSTTGYRGAPHPTAAAPLALYKSPRPSAPAPLPISPHKRGQPLALTTIDSHGQSWTFNKSAGVWINAKSGVRSYEAPK